MENSRNKQFISFKLHAILSSVMKSCALLPQPNQDSINHPFAPLVSHLGADSVIRSTGVVFQCCVQVTLILPNNDLRAPEQLCW